MAANLDRDRFDAALQAIEGIVWTNNAAGEMVGEQDGWSALTGQSYDEYKGFGWADAVHPDDAQPTINAWNASVSERKPFIFEHRVKRHDGAWRLFSIRAIPILNDDGEIREWVGVHTDITEQRNLATSHEQERLKFKTLANAIPQLAWMTDETGYIYWYNERWFDYTGTTLDEMQGWGWKKVHHPDHMPRVVELLKDCFENGRDWEDIFPLRGKDGQFRWFLSRATTIKDQDGKIQGWIGTNTDITAAKKTEEYLIKAKNAAEEASEAKSEFLANMSHEIRTPLNAIVGIAEILSKGGLDKTKHETLLRTLHSSSSTLTGLINDLLDISKIEERSFRLEENKVCFDDLFEEIQNMFAIKAEDKNVDIIFDYSKLKGYSFIGDPLRLKQILVNIVGNALKFTPEGSITLDASFVKDDAPDHGFKIQIRDTGIGIPEDALQTLFEKFTRAGNVGNTPGSGLGLTISKHLTEMMGGRIDVQSMLGRGTKITIHLPQPAFSTEDDVPNNDRDLVRSATWGHNKKILLVEDYEPNIIVTTAMLDDLDLAYDVARDGNEAVDYRKKNTYDLILMDVNMPHKNGIEATKEIRVWEKAHKVVTVPIIGMTALALSDDKGKCMDAGMNDYLAKPVSEQKLHSVVAAQISEQ